GVVRCLEPERLRVEVARGVDGAEASCPGAALDEGGAGTSSELRVLLARGPAQLERSEPVMRRELRVILCALGRQLFDPFRRAAVLLRPLEPRNLAVGDVTDEGVRKRILGLPRNGRASL